MSYGGDGYNIWVMNSSTKTIIVTGVLLRDCENIRSECGAAIRLQVRVEPGRRQTVYLVRVGNKDRASTFRFSYAWSGVPSP
jgi:P pilus assembly chaperone PapD